MGMNLSRPYGTCDLFAFDPALKRRAIVVCPFGTRRERWRATGAHRSYHQKDKGAEFYGRNNRLYVHCVTGGFEGELR